MDAAINRLRNALYLALGIVLAFFLCAGALVHDARAAGVPGTFWGVSQGIPYTGTTAGNITTYTPTPGAFGPVGGGAGWSSPATSSGAASWSATAGGAGATASRNIALNAGGASATLVQKWKIPTAAIGAQVGKIAKGSIVGVAASVVAPILVAQGLTWMSEAQQYVKSGEAGTGNNGTTYPAIPRYGIVAGSNPCNFPGETGTKGSIYDDPATPITQCIAEWDARSTAVTNGTWGYSESPFTGWPNCSGSGGYDCAVNVWKQDNPPNGPFSWWVAAFSVHKQWTCPGGGSIASGATTMTATCAGATACASGEVRNSSGMCVPGGGGTAATPAEIDAAASAAAGADPVAAAQGAAQAPWDLPADTPAEITTPGPVQTPGKTSTQTDANGNVTTNTTYQNITFNTSGDTITNNTFTTTVNNVTTTAVNGVQQSTTTAPADPLKDDPPTFSDPTFPVIGKLYERKYPDGLIGVWNDHKEALLQSSFIQSINGMFNLQAAGSCPSWIINGNIASWANFGSFDVSPPCWLWSAMALVILTTAAFTSRAIIFGG